MRVSGGHKKEETINTRASILQLPEQAARRFLKPDVTSIFGGSLGHENWRSLLPPGSYGQTPPLEKCEQPDLKHPHATLQNDICLQNSPEGGGFCLLAHGLTDGRSAFVASYAAAPKKCTSLPEQSVTLVPSTPRACKFTSLSYMKTNLKKKNC